MNHQLTLKEFISILDIRSGRIHTKDYIISLFAMSGLEAVVKSLVGISFIFLPISIITFLFVTYCHLVLVVKRLRDIGLGWYFAIPLYLLTFIIYLSFFNLNHLQKHSYQYSVLGNSIFYDEMMNASVSLVILVVINFIATLVLIFWPSQKHHNKYGKFRFENDLTRSISIWIFALINPVLFFLGVIIGYQAEVQDVSRI